MAGEQVCVAGEVREPEAGATVGVVAVCAVASVGWAARQAGSAGPGGTPAAARGDPAPLPEEGAEPAPETAAVCRSQQECTCRDAPSRGHAQGLVQPAEVARQQRVADERHGVDQRVRDDQRPQPAGALPRVPEHQSHREIAQARAEALIEVVGAT